MCRVRPNLAKRSGYNFLARTNRKNNRRPNSHRFSHCKSSPRMLRSVCSASPITHSVENFIIKTITSRFLLLIRNAKGQCEGIQKRFSRKPLAAPAQDYKTAQPPKPPQNKGWCQGVHNLRKLPDTPRNYPVPVSVVRIFYD